MSDLEAIKQDDVKCEGIDNSDWSWDKGIGTIPVEIWLG